MNELDPIQTLQSCWVRLVWCLLRFSADCVEEVGMRSISAAEYEWVLAELLKRLP